MNGTNYFQHRYGEETDIGELAPSGTPDFEIGTAMRKTDPEVCVPADGKMTGFLTKKVTTAGPTFEELTLADPNSPAKYGNKVTLKQIAVGGIIEVEGEASKAYNADTDGLLVTSGTGDVTSAAAGDALSLQNGRWRAAQTGDFVCGRVIRQMTPNTAGNVRLEIEVLAGDVAVA